MPFCTSKLLEIPIENAAANILCAHHNNSLSEVDDEAGKFRSALAQCVDKTDVASGDTLYRGPDTIQISGERFSRWITKTVCNLAVIDKREPDPDFITYSFCQPTDRALHFYVYVKQGLALHLNDDHFQVRHFWGDDGVVLFYLGFFGLHWFATNFDVRKDRRLQLTAEGHGIDTAHLMERPRVVNFAQDLGHGVDAVKYRLELDWSSAPATT